LSKIINTAVLAALVLSLAACSASGPETTPTPDASGGACPAAAPGKESAKIEVAGELGSEPKVTFDKGLKAENTERSVVIEGDGEVAKSGVLVTLDLVAYNATTGDEISATLYKPGGTTSFALDPDQLIPGLYKAIACSAIGSRVVTIVPPADAFGSSGNSSLGVGADDSIIFVTDVEAIAPLRATGKDQPAEEGMPTVMLAADGTPTIKVPDTEAPEDLKISVLKKGDGTEVKDGDSVTVQYQGVIWDTGEVFDQSWGRAPFTTLTGGVIKGFGQALIGHTVGSQVLAVIPPKDGYGDEGTTGIKGTDTLVFVIDILATTTPPAS